MCKKILIIFIPLITAFRNMYKFLNMGRGLLAAAFDNTISVNKRTFNDNLFCAIVMRILTNFNLIWKPSFLNFSVLCEKIVIMKSTFLCKNKQKAERK